MTRLLLLALLLNCQVSNPTLVDEFVHGEVQSRKRVIEQAFALWQVRGQVEVTAEKEKNQHRIVFTDTCQEDFTEKFKATCIKTIVDQQTIGSCSFLLKKSIIIIRRSYYQNVANEHRVALLAHELGHCMGLDHSLDSADIMFYTPHSGNMEPSEAEVAKLHSMWPEGHLFKFHLYEGY